MSESTSSTIPIPAIFHLEPHPWDSRNLERFMDSIGEFATVGFDNSKIAEQTGDTATSYLFNRFRTPPMFYMLGNNGNFGLDKILEPFLHYVGDNRIAGFVVMVDLRWYTDQHIKDFGDTIDYITTWKRRIALVYPLIQKTPYIVAVGNPDNLTWDESELRQTLDIAPDIPILEHDYSSAQVSQIYREIFIRQTTHSREDIQPILDALAHKK